MSTATPNTFGLTRMVAHAILTLVVGIVVSICTLIVHALIILFGRRKSVVEKPGGSSESHARACSICQRAGERAAGEVMTSP